MPALFDTYLIVDWSAANQRKTGADSIWICRRDRYGERVANPPTRLEARTLLAKWLGAAMARGDRVLLGFDFPFGYPAGFAGLLGLRGIAWRAVWTEIARRIEDKPNNNNNRFEVADALNKRASDGRFRFPFWGCPVKSNKEFLGPKHHRQHAERGLAEKRLIDKWMVGAQPCWKLLGTGSVGSQTLTGIPVVWALRNDRRWHRHARIWPLETGLRAPTDARIVFAEIWPSWWKVRPNLGKPNDQAQVRTVAQLFAARDRAGTLAAVFSGDRSLTPAQRRVAETEEAWTLGVTSRRNRRQRSLAPKNPSSFPRKRESSGPGTPAPPLPDPPPLAGEGRVGAGVTTEQSDEGEKSAYTYLRDPAAIYRRSFALVRAEADLARFPAALRPLAIRLAHAAGDTAILDDLAWSRGAVEAGRRALAGAAAILVDSAMLGAGIMRERLPAGNEVICTLRDPGVPALATTHKTTRSAAAVELWRPRLAGAVVAIGNAPTALFRLLEILAAGGGVPALILGFPVGFVGAAEAKEALIGFGAGGVGCGLAFVTVKGRRGGSALAAAAVNALCGKPPAKGHK